MDSRYAENLRKAFLKPEKALKRIIRNSYHLSHEDGYRAGLKLGKDIVAKLTGD